MAATALRCPPLANTSIARQGTVYQKSAGVSYSPGRLFAQPYKQAANYAGKNVVVRLKWQKPNRLQPVLQQRPFAKRQQRVRRVHYYAQRRRKHYFVSFAEP